MEKLALSLSGRQIDEIKSDLIREARAMHEEDIAINRMIGANGAAVVPDGATILTHCNAGALATGGYGTALGVVRWSGGSREKKSRFWPMRPGRFSRGPD